MYESSTSLNKNDEDDTITDNKPQISCIMIMSQNDSMNDTYLTNMLMVTWFNNHNDEETKSKYS